MSFKVPTKCLPATKAVKPGLYHITTKSAYTTSSETHGLFQTYEAPEFFLKEGSIYLVSEKTKATFHGKAGILRSLAVMQKQPGLLSSGTLKNTIRRLSVPSLPEEVSFQDQPDKSHPAWNNCDNDYGSLSEFPKILVLSEPIKPENRIGFSVGEYVTNVTNTTKTLEPVDNGAWYQKVLNLTSEKSDIVWLNKHFSDSLFTYFEFYELLEDGTFSCEPVGLPDETLSQKVETYPTYTETYPGGTFPGNTSIPGITTTTGGFSPWEISEKIYGPSNPSGLSDPSFPNYTASSPTLIKTWPHTTFGPKPGTYSFDVKVNLPSPSEYITLDLEIENPAKSTRSNKSTKKKTSKKNSVKKGSTKKTSKSSKSKISQEKFLK